MSRFETFLFDLDGTLIDHFTAIQRCYAHTLPQLGLPAPTLEQVRAAVGGGLENTLANFIEPARIPEALKIYRAHWEKTMLQDVTLLPGARELLEFLHARQARLAVLTNKLGTSSRQLSAHLGLTSLLDLVIGANDTPWLKPERDLTLQVLTQLGGDPATALFIGDSPYDVEAAHNAGFPCWVVTTGTHSAEQLRAAGADAVFTDLREIHAALAAPNSAQPATSTL